MRAIVYTADIGSYDSVAPCDSSAALHLLFTDGTGAPPGWQHMPIHDPGDVDGRIRLARDLKIRPHRWLPAHDASIWIDGNMRLETSPQVLLRCLDVREIATFRYPSTFGPRDCLYDEAAACIRRNKDAAPVIEAQVQRYRDAGYPAKNGLVETSVLVRLNSPMVAEFGEAWWSEVERGSRRDQISFNYAAWATRLDYGLLPGSRIDNPFASWRPHQRDVYGRP